MTLDVVAVEAFTRGRLDRDDDETQRQLDAALAAARRYCGWHVTPVATSATVTLDGPGQRVLILPTLALGAVSAVTENGVSIDTDTISWSARGMVVKLDNTLWAEGFGNITATITHGYADAADFESVVLSAIDRGGFSVGDAPRVIGPFQYSDPAGGTGALFTDAEKAVLDLYRLEKAA